jgi:subtilase family serine protease
MMVGVALLATLLASVAGNGFARQPSLTRHVPDVVASGAAQRIGSPSPAQTMEVTVELPSRNEAELHSLLSLIYDPASPFYRHFLSVAQFTDRFGPSEADYRTLLRFAEAHHLQPHALVANRRALDVQASVADMERAFNVKIGLYRTPGESRAFYAPDREPTLDLGTRALHVSGLDNYVLPIAHHMPGSQADASKFIPTGSGPRGNFTGSDMRAAYYGGTALDGAGQSVGLLEYYGYNLADVKLYFEKLGQQNNVPIVGVSLNGARLRCAHKCDDSEQVLDMEEALSLAPGMKQLVVYVGHNDVSIINQMANDISVKQFSCSWGWGADPVALDPIFEEMAAQGQTFLVATGDFGYKLKKGGVWPADDDYVTAVGGTDLTTYGPGGAWRRERGWRFSGGGASPNGIPIPKYQVPFVNAKNGGSKTQRNVPDVAANANFDFFTCADGRCATGWGGTSYAAPIWAGYIALANQYAAAIDKPAIGFMNPAVYRLGAKSEYAQVFHDDVKGYNGYYTAGTGFDLVTGFGSPTGEAFIRALVR